MNGKVLIVDDDREIRQLLRIILQNAAYDVEEAEDGFAAMEKVYTFRPHTIVLDLMMPEITGYQVCRLIKNDPYFNTVPVIILTALDGQEDRQRSLLTGADHFYTKPIRFADFLKLIKKCIQKFEDTRKLAPPVPEHLEKPTRNHILHTTNQILDKHLYQLTALDEIIKIMTSTFDLDKVLRMVIKGARKGLGFSRGWIALVNDEGTELVGKIREGVGGANNDERVKIPIVDDDAQPALLALKLGRPVMVNNYSTDERFSSVLKGGLKSESFVDMPFVVKGEVMGILRVDDYLSFKPLTQTRLKLLETFSQQAGIAIDNSRLHKKTVMLTEELKRKVREMEALIQSSHIINSTLDQKELLKKIITVARDFFNFKNCSILLTNDEGTALYMEALDGDYRDDIDDLTIPLNTDTIAGTVACEKRALIVNNVTVHPKYLSGVKNARSELAVPMITHNKVIGVFNVESTELNAFTEHDKEVLKALADQAALAIENSYLVGQLQKMAITDELTSLYNRRHFLKSMEMEMKRAKRYGRALSIMFFDIDNFKRYNDTYLHEMGDELLVKITQTLKDTIRSDVDIPARWTTSSSGVAEEEAPSDTIDIPARWGGEEFVILLPETNEEQAALTAERFREAAEEMPPLRDGFNTVTVSIGTATYHGEDITADELINRADAAMYYAKQHGKNRVIAWDDSIAVTAK